MATATIYGTNFTIAANVTPATALEACKWQGKVRVVVDRITGGAAGDAGSLLYIGKLPKGAIPIAVLLSSDTTNAITGTIGWTGDTDALGTFTTLAASNVAGGKWSFPSVPNTVLTADVDVYITTAAAALENGKYVDARIFYALE